MRALDDMENANAQVEVSVEEVTKARTQKIKVFHSSILLLSVMAVA
jgi:HAUS augmin-like complex subunit 3